MIPLQTASRHPVSHILFSPDGSAVAVAQPHYGVTILERATGRTLAVCELPRRALLSGFTFCGDGKYLATAHAKGVEVFDAATGTPVFKNFHWPWAHQLATHGELVVGAPLATFTSLRPVLNLGNTVDLLESKQTVLYRSDLALVACAPDSSHVLALSADRDRFVLLNVAANRTVAEFEHPASLSRAKWVVRFCPNGRRFAINYVSTLDVYDPAELAEEGEDEQQADTPLVQRANGTQTAVASVRPASRASLAGQSRLDAEVPHVGLAPVFSLKPDKPGASEWYPPFALAADGRGLLVKRPRNRVQLWDAPTGTLVNEWSWRFEWVTCVAMSADGLTAVAGGRFGRVILWDLE